MAPLAGVPTHLDKLDLSAPRDPQKLRAQYKVCLWGVGGVGWRRGCAGTIQGAWGGAGGMLGSTEGVVLGGLAAWAGR